MGDQPRELDAFDPDLRFDRIEECTWCCHHGVVLSESDFLELADRADLREATTQFRGQEFVRPATKDREAAHDHCEGLDVSDRRVFDNLAASLPAVLWDLDDPETKREL